MNLLREYIQVLLSEATWPSSGSWDEWSDDSEYDAKLRVAFVNSAQHGLQLAKSLGADIAEPMQYIVDKLNEAYELRYELQDERERRSASSIPDRYTNRQKRIAIMWDDIKDVFRMIFHENLKGTDDIAAYVGSRLPQYMMRANRVLIKPIDQRYAPSNPKVRTHTVDQEFYENLAEWAGIQI